MSFIKSWLRPDIQTIAAYHVPSAENMIKLDAMESPFPLPDSLVDEYLLHLTKADVNRYPDPSAKELKQTLRELMDIPNEYGVLLGNGSDELIQLLALACETGDVILSVEPSFVMYRMIAKFTHLNYVGVDLDANFQLDLPSMQAAITAHKPKLIFIAYPNNPTANSFNRANIESIIQSTKALVVLDEAYYVYANDSFLNDITRYPNLIVLRTVSKIGFAGLRLGLLIGSQTIVTQLDKLRLPYNINTLTQVSGNFLLQQKQAIEKNANTILAQRQILADALNSIESIKVYPSQANFILFKADSANALFEYLKANSVLVKNLSNAPKLQNCLRVTVGDETQNQRFIELAVEFYSQQEVS